MLLGRENQLLAALPAAVYRRWEEALCVREDAVDEARDGITLASFKPAQPSIYMAFDKFPEPVKSRRR